MGTGRGRGWTAGAGLVLLAFLVAAGPAAHAVFTSVVRATGFTVSTHSLAAPVGNVVVATCTPVGNSGKHRLDIVVTSHGNVPKANAYVLVATDPSGQESSPVTLAPGGRYSSSSAAGGKWTYSVEARFNVPGSTNFWRSSTPSPYSIYC